MGDPHDASGSPVTVTVGDDGVAVVRLDDGRANALGPATIGALHDALDRAEADADAVTLVGRPGRFSAGFDLGVIRQGPDAARDLVARGGELCLRLATFPRVVVAACTGHALAAGALVLLSCDLRLGADVDARIGLPEVGIGLYLPRFATLLARERLDRRHLVRATVLARVYGPADAVEVGFLDEVVAADELEERARAEAAALGGSLSRHGLIETRRRLHGDLVDEVATHLSDDLSDFGVPD